MTLDELKQEVVDNLSMETDPRGIEQYLKGFIGTTIGEKLVNPETDESMGVITLIKCGQLEVSTQRATLTVITDTGDIYDVNIIKAFAGLRTPLLKRVFDNINEELGE